MKSTTEKLNLLKEQKKFCKLYLELNKVEKTISGYVLDLSEEFILFRELSDFNILGYIIIKSSNIKKIKQSKYEASFTKMIKSENLLDKIYDHNILPLNDYSEFFKIIRKNYKFCIVENVVGTELDLCIGEIKRIGKSNISILYFDATGKFDKEVSVIPFSEIMNIEFNSDYINIFRKYLRNY